MYKRGGILIFGLFKSSYFIVIPLEQKLIKHRLRYSEMMGVKLLSLDQRCCLLNLIKRNYLRKNFSKNSNLDDSGISLSILSSRTNLKLHNISKTPKMVKKVIANLDSSEVSYCDCIPVLVLEP